MPGDQHNARLLNYIREINSAKAEHEVLSAIAKFVEPIGFDFLHIGPLINPIARRGSKPFASNWPKELVSRRKQNFDIIHDPIARCALRSKRPFRWNRAIEYATRTGVRIVSEAAEFGLIDGWMFPMHSLDGPPGGVSLAARERLDAFLDISAIELVSQHAYFRLEALNGPIDRDIAIELSERELEAVQCAAAGKTNNEIATILGLSGETVKEYLRRAAQKLRADNRAHTVANAIAANLILP